MSREKLSDKSLQNASGGIRYERLKMFSIMTEDKNGNTVEVKNVDDIKPNKHYWLSPHTGRDGDWMVLGYGSDGNAERFVRAINGESSLNLQDVECLSENYSDLV